VSHSRFLNLILPLIFAYCISGCKSKEPQIFESLPSSHTNITFNNTITTTDSLNGSPTIIYIMVVVLPLEI
jgi:hypothetical protein